MMEPPEVPLADEMTCDLPRVLWIELTSRCPFDCIFCSRKTLRGAGRHMDFGLCRRILDQLRNPEVIRLNYSGESIHYPRLAEAIDHYQRAVQLSPDFTDAQNNLNEARARAGEGSPRMPN